MTLPKALRGLGGPQRRIALSSLIILLLLAFAIAITIWRYESALDQSRNALAARGDSFRAEQAARQFWREREAINEYLLTRNADLFTHVAATHRRYLNEIQSARAGFLQTMEGLNDRAEEVHLRDLARSGNESFLSTFRRNRGVLANGPLLAKLNAAEDAVFHPLDSLKAMNATELQAAEASADSASSEAEVAALIGGALALLICAFHALRLGGRLAGSEQRLRMVLDTMSDGLVAADTKGNFLIFNRAAESILGKGAANVGTPRWQTHYGVYFPDGSTPVPPEELPLARALMGHTVGATELVIRNEHRPQGSCIEISANPLRQKGRPVGGVALLRDITERKRTETELARKEGAEHANQAKSEFLSRMSHELRTPLNAVLGFGQLLEISALDTRQQGNVAQILKGGRHLLELIDEVLDISRIEAGKMTISLEPVHVGRTVGDVLDLVGPLAAERDITLERPPSEAADRFVMADNQRLKQVLLNLLSNAIKYNRDGGSVTVSLVDNSRSDLLIHVADTGQGLSEKQLTKLFDPFERVGAELTSIEGTGLGLTLSKLLVEAMGGTLAVESEPSVGTTFMIKLALAEAPSATAAGFAESTDASANGSPGKTGTILYVEDNLANFELVEQIVSERPELELLAAMQGSLGLELARRHHPDLILLDLHLPDIQGDEVLRSLRHDPATREIPVVVVSADATAGQIKRLIEAGAHDYLTKPLDVTRFLEVVDEALSARIEA
jgi:signal transduction histidine kinase/CheY-like chemotaxis protein